MSHDRAFLDDIREHPDDDAPRLIYAGWLDEHGDGARAEFIRVQCELARLKERDRRRKVLARRKQELLEAHRLAWTDLAFADWLEHRKKDCHNPEGHSFCRLVARGVRLRCERDRLLPEDRRRGSVAKRLKAAKDRMEDDYNYHGSTADYSLFDEAKFHRGFVEAVEVQDYAVVCFAEALSDLGVLRDLEIQDDGDAELGDRVLERLSRVLDRLSLRRLSIDPWVFDWDALECLTRSPGLKGVTELRLNFHVEDDGTGDEGIRVLAASPHLTNLRSLRVEDWLTFTDASVQAILDSPYLANLTECDLTDNEGMQISPSMVRRFRARFGTQP